MKTLILVLLVSYCSICVAQTKGKPGKVIRSQTAPASQAPEGVTPRETATERYLNGPVRNGQRDSTSTTSKNTSDASPFVGGMHAAGNASTTFDTTNATRNTSNTNRSITARTTIAGGNDTTFNANTISQGGVTTNSGAVDRSGQAQFGQTNWGNSRSTVGESQWTIPPPITASFNKEFPAANSANWTRNNIDTTLYSARYKTGAQWVTTTYNLSGQRMDMRTEFPLVQPPRPVSVFIAKQPSTFEVAIIYKLQVQGKPDVYELHTKNGRVVYVNNDGMEVNY